MKFACDLANRGSQADPTLAAEMELSSRISGAALRGVADQALTSAENFAVGIILIRNCTKDEFGLYALGYGILVLAWSLIAAQITAQMPMILSREAFSREERQMQYGSLLRTLLVACALVTGFGCVLTLLAAQLRIVASFDAYYWLLLSLALPGISLRDFMRRYFFQEQTETRALLMDASALALTIATLGLMVAIHAAHMHRVAVTILALGGLSVSTWGIVGDGLLLESRKLPGDTLRAFRFSWLSGQWNTGATLMSWIQNQAYTFFVTAMIGLSGLATANAPRVLLTPITLLSTGFALPLLPYFAKQKDNLHTIVSVRSAQALLAVTVVFVGVYTLALWLLRDSFIPLILGTRYHDIWPYIVAWAIANAFANVRIYYSTFLLAKRGFRQLAVASVFSAATVICLTGPMIHLFGVVGSVYSIAAGELLLGVTTWLRSRAIATSALSPPGMQE